jgi:hypothetical protein
MMIAFLIAAGMNFFSYWNSDRMVLSAYRAQQVDERNAPEFFAIIRDLAHNAGLPMPKVYLYDSPQPNAFATGRNPENAAVAASTGLLQALSPEEVAGVMAHELAHIQNRDTLTMTITATLAGAISMLGNFAFFFGGNRENNNPLGFIGVLVAMIVAPLAAMHARIFGRPPRRRNLRQSALARFGTRQDRPRCRPCAERGCRAQSGDGSYVHHQSALRRAHGQSVFHASEHGKPHCRAAGDGAKRHECLDGTGSCC